MNNAGCLGTYSLKRKCIYDHSLIQWYYQDPVEDQRTEETPKQNIRSPHENFSRHIPKDFMGDKNDDFIKLNVRVDALTGNQVTLDDIYSDFSNCVKEEMYDKLKYKVYTNTHRDTQMPNKKKDEKTMVE